VSIRLAGDLWWKIPRVPKSPLADPTFRSLWLAQAGSGVGTWMQTVGAQWMLVHQAHAATLVSIVQAASLLPVMFVSLPAGVLADLLDRRQILIAAQSGMAVIAALLAVLTATHLTTPTLLIIMTFLLGIGQALTNPAWQAIQPMLVPREQIPAAAALNSMNVNISRAIGPALAGVIVAVSGPWVVFAINAVSFSGVLVALVRWNEPSKSGTGAESLLPAMRSGTRYLRYAPGVRRILLRAGLFVLPASALWALLPIVTSQRLNIGSGGYGLLLGALGVGAVVGALALSRIRKRMSSNAVLVVFSLVFAAGTATAGMVTNTPVVVIAMFISGIAWLAVLSTLNTVMQLVLPAWVRARGLSAYLIVFMGGQGLGSLLWGAIAAPLGTAVTLVVAAVALAAGVVTFAWLPLHGRTETLDRTIAHFPEPTLAFTPDPDDGPVIVALIYRVPADRVDSFVSSMRELGQSRQRTGATRWGLFRDAGDAERYVELFEVPSWSEHELQHRERLTGYDADLLTETRQYTTGDPEIHHLISTLASRHLNPAPTLTRSVVGAPASLPASRLVAPGRQIPHSGHPVDPPMLTWSVIDVIC
jgi:MFS family permease